MSTLYFKAVVPISEGGFVYKWEEPLNWFTDAAATTPADNVPWVDGVDYTYLSYNLALATGSLEPPIITGSVGAGATGTCNIDSLSNDAGIVSGGTFSGSGFLNGGVINDGTFSGTGFTNWGNIWGGSFTGTGLLNGGPLYYYYVGWDGSGYDSEGYDANDLYQTHTGWNGTYYFIDSVQTTLSEFGTGVWDGNYYSDGILIEAITGLDGVHLYFKAEVATPEGKFLWEEPLNWFQDSTARVPAANAPWVDGVDSTYLDYDLVMATGNQTGPQLNIDIGTGATGTCSVGFEDNNLGSINGGNFPADGFAYGGTITGGSFTGDGKMIDGTITGGTIRGSMLSFTAYITGGHFYTSGVLPNQINGGTWQPVGGPTAFSDLIDSEGNQVLPQTHPRANPGFPGEDDSLFNPAVTGIPKPSDILGAGLL